MARNPMLNPNTQYRKLTKKAAREQRKQQVARFERNPNQGKQASTAAGFRTFDTKGKAEANPKGDIALKRTALRSEGVGETVFATREQRRYELRVALGAQDQSKNVEKRANGVGMLGGNRVTSK